MWPNGKAQDFDSWYYGFESHHPCFGGDFMNIVFYLIVIIVAVILWFLLAFIFYPLGKFVHRIFSDALHELNRDNEKSTRKGDEN